MKLNQVQKDFERDFRAALEAVAFPADKIEPGFITAGVIAFSVNTAHAVGCPNEQYQSILKRLDPTIAQGEWNLFDISFVVNTIEDTSARDFGMRLDQYAELIAKTRRMSELWNDMVLPIKTAVAEKNTPRQGPKLVPSSNKKRSGTRGR